jgi:hypothetical protein
VAPHFDFPAWLFICHMLLDCGNHTRRLHLYSIPYFQGNHQDKDHYNLPCHLHPYLLHRSRIDLGWSWQDRQNSHHCSLPCHLHPYLLHRSRIDLGWSWQDRQDSCLRHQERRHRRYLFRQPHHS